MMAKATRANEVLMFNHFICACWLMRQFDLLSSYHHPIPISSGNRHMGRRDTPCAPLLAYGRAAGRGLPALPRFVPVGRAYFNFGKNPAAVLHVAALNSSSEQPFTWATVSEISFT